MAIDAVIFNLDGTLADTLPDIAWSMNRVLEARGLPAHEPDAYRYLVGEGVRRLVERALPAGAGELADEVEREYRAVYARHLLDRSRPYPGVPELLAALAARRVPMAVLSNKPHEPTGEMTSALFGETPFVAVLGRRPDVPRKPDPTAALELAERLGAAPARTGFVGDTAVNVETARAAGMVAIGALWGYREREELVEAGAAHLLERPNDLLLLFS